MTLNKPVRKPPDGSSEKPQSTNPDVPMLTAPITRTVNLCAPSRAPSSTPAPTLFAIRFEKLGSSVSVRDRAVIT